MFEKLFSIKMKGKFTLLPKHRAMEKYRGVEVKFHAFLTPALYGSEWSVSRFGCLNHARKRSYCYLDMMLVGSHRRSGCGDEHM
jgi:hypothetical protein